MDLGRIGIWSGELRSQDVGEASRAAVELESLGYGTLWINNGRDGRIFDRIRALLSATERVVIATGIANIWDYPAADVAEGFHAIDGDFPGRVLGRIGGSDRRAKTYDAMVAYLDALDSAPNPIPTSSRLLAALGPRMLRLAAARSLGAHPYNVSVEYTKQARSVLGMDPLLAPEQALILETDPARAREIARQRMGVYMDTPNYARNFLRSGFTKDDLKDGGSDRLIDAFIAWGDVPALVERVRQQQAAGADHVCIQVLTPTPGAFPYEAWRTLAKALVS